MTCAPSCRPRVPLRDAPLEFARESAANRVRVRPQQGPAGSITRHVTVLCSTAPSVGLETGTGSPPASYAGGDASDGSDQSWRLPGPGYRNPR